MNDKVNFRIITDYITANHLTKKEFCKQCNVSISTFYRIAHGKNFDLHSLFKMAKRMNIAFHLLFN
ncbi:MAG: helix-turn-helix transcriptional regulator [Clostridia bacterium]|jgi:predicted transcriptional regulator|nr:helix-turn-helix transcriptional regulator [Clostridia bacterium]